MRLCITCLRCYEDDISCSDETHEAMISARLGSCIIDGKYRLIRMLERGGMGAIYESAHLELDRRLAIKILVPEYVSADPHARLRLRQEALTACKFDHPNLVRLYDFGTNAVTVKDEEHNHVYDEQYIVMELLQGQSLKEMLVQNKRLALPKALAIAIQIGEGLAEIHSKGIIYRDLKPANVLVCSDYKGDMVVKIVDFGAVKLRNSTSNHGGLDLTKAMFVGSPIYASPENCKGEPLDERSDIYSLGLILYEMIAGFRAFEGNFLKLLNSHAHGDPPPLTNVPSSIADLVMTALRKDPNDRPQTAREFVERLRGLELGNSPIRLVSNIRTAAVESCVIDNEETVVTRRDQSLQSRPATKVSIPVPRPRSRFNLKRELTVATVLLVCFTQGDSLTRKPQVRQNYDTAAAIPPILIADLSRSPLVKSELVVTRRSPMKLASAKSKGSNDPPPSTKKSAEKRENGRSATVKSPPGSNSRSRNNRAIKSRQARNGRRNQTRNQRNRDRRPSSQRRIRFGRRYR